MARNQMFVLALICSVAAVASAATSPSSAPSAAPVASPYAAPLPSFATTPESGVAESPEEGFDLSSPPEPAFDSAVAPVADAPSDAPVADVPKGGAAALTASAAMGTAAVAGFFFFFF